MRSPVSILILDANPKFFSQQVQIRFLYKQKNLLNRSRAVNKSEVTHMCSASCSARSCERKQISENAQVYQVGWKLCLYILTIALDVDQIFQRYQRENGEFYHTIVSNIKGDIQLQTKKFELYFCQFGFVWYGTVLCFLLYSAIYRAPNLLNNHKRFQLSSLCIIYSDHIVLKRFVLVQA